MHSHSTDDAIAERDRIRSYLLGSAALYRKHGLIGDAEALELAASEVEALSHVFQASVIASARRY